jgi:hypothetical protein
VDRFQRRTLRRVRAGFPAVHRGKGNAEALRQDLLTEAQLRADVSEKVWNSSVICHICQLCYNKPAVKPPANGDQTTRLRRFGYKRVIDYAAGNTATRLLLQSHHTSRYNIR